MHKIAAFGLAASLAWTGAAFAQTCSSSLPHTLTNGATADATQLMDNFNTLKSCLNGVSNVSGNVGIGTTSPGTESANAKLAIAGSPGQVATTLAQSNANALLSLRPDTNSGYTMALGAGPGDLPYAQGVNWNGGAAAASILLNPFGASVGIGTTNPYAESVSAKLAILGMPGQVATTLSQSNTNAILSLRSDSNSGYTMAMGAGPGDWPYIQGVNWNGGAAAAHVLLNPFGGNVGIGTTSPAYTLQVNGSAAGTSAWINLSDGRLKTNIDPVTDGLAVIQRLRPVRFNWLSSDSRSLGKELTLSATTRQVGFIAQEVQAVVPEAVIQGGPGLLTSPSAPAAPAYYGLKEGDLVPFLVSAVQQQQAMIAALQARVTALEAQLPH